MNKRDNYATTNSTKRPRIDERRTYHATMTQRPERLTTHLRSDEDHGETANYPTMMRRAMAPRLLRSTRIIRNRSRRGQSHAFNRFMLLKTKDSAHYGNHRCDRRHNTDHHGRLRPRSNDVFQGHNDYPRNSDRLHDNCHACGPHDRNRHYRQNGPLDAPNLDDEGENEGARDHDEDRTIRATSSLSYWR